MKRILILANNDVGLYKFRKDLIQELITQGNQIYISLPDGKFVRDLETMGCKFINTDIDRRGINPKTDIKLMIFYKKIIEQVQPDLVITYTIKPNIYGGMVCRLLQKEYVANITGLGTAFQREGILKSLVIFLYKVALKKVKIVFFENVENKNIMLDKGIVKKEKVHVLNGAGVNLEEYPFCKYPSEGKIRFLFIGRVMKEKGIDELFEVAERIRREEENIVFDIVGPMEDDYREYVDKLMKRGIIEYYGYQEDVKSFIQRCHCFVLPSYHEGMANTLLEAGAMGRPLITSRIHGCMEAVAEGRNGFLAEAKNSEELYSVLKKFCLCEYSKRVQMGEESRKLVAEKFDRKKIVLDTLKKLENIGRSI